MEYKALCVIGLGYIGLPTAATFASRGLKVIGVDVNQQVVDTNNSGGIHIIEPDLDIVVRSVVQTGNLSGKLALSSVENALTLSDVLVLLVDHKEFIGLPLSVLNISVLVDTRGVWNL